MNVLYFSPEDNLDRYLREVGKQPYLTVEDEQQLARRWRDKHDASAMRDLAGSHLRLVVKMARGYSGYGLPISELIAEGNVGLMQAIAKFEPERGYRLATYAAWWIRAAIQEYILHNWSLVKTGTTAAQKKLFFNLRRLKGKLRAMEEGDLAPDQVTQIAQQLDVPEHDVIEMNRRLSAADTSLNIEIGDDTDVEWQDRLTDDRDNQESRLADANELAWRRDLLNEGLGLLNERERHILLERRLTENPRTLEALSGEYGVSRERVRQIEVAAFRKLQKAICGNVESKGAHRAAA